FSTALELALAGQVTPANFVNPPSPIGTTSSTEANINTDVETTVHNETTIAVNPTNPLNMVGTANDFQVFLPEGGFFYATQFSRPRVTFNGGQTWTPYAIPFRGYNSTADPAVAFDADGTAYLSTIATHQSQISAFTNFDIIVSHSSDGGPTWAQPVVVA